MWFSSLSTQRFCDSSLNTYKRRWERFRVIYHRQRDCRARTWLLWLIMPRGPWHSTFWFWNNVKPPYDQVTVNPDPWSYRFEYIHFTHSGQLWDRVPRAGQLRQFDDVKSFKRLVAIWRALSDIPFHLLFGAIHLLGYKSYFRPKLRAIYGSTRRLYRNA